MRRGLFLLPVFALLGSCRSGTRTQTVNEAGFKKMAPFDAMVVESKVVPFMPGTRRHSARIADYRVMLRLKDGSVLVVDRVSRDANWPWVAASLAPGKEYRFPKAMYENHNRPPASPEFKIEMHKREDSLRVSIESGTVTFVVSSRSGIGGATIRRVSGKWPARVLVRLPFRNLESFSVDSGKLALKTGLEWGGKAYPLESRGGYKGPADVHRLPLRKKERYIEAELPRGFMSLDAKTLSVGWIDAYR